MAGNTVRQIDWDDPTIQYHGREGSGDIVRLALDTNQHTRVALLHEKADLVLVHYIGAEGQRGRYYRCLADTEEGCPGCQYIGEPNNRFGSNVIWYDCNPQTGALNTPLKFQIALWTYGNDKFVQLRGIRQEWGDLRKLDLSVHCTEKNYQRLVITPCKECAWTRQPPEVVKQTAEFVKKNLYNVVQIIGKTHPRAEVLLAIAKAKPELGLGAPAAAAAGASMFTVPGNGIPISAETATGAATETIAETDFDALLGSI
jgi:hypothetical protein